MRSPSHVPPGSRVRWTRVPRSLRWVANRSAWVVLPPPSGPSTVMSAPRRTSPPDIGASVAGPLRAGRRRSVIRRTSTRVPSTPWDARPDPTLDACSPPWSRPAWSSALPAVVLAHPLGNFTINHYAEVRVEAERVLLDVVIDQAEIPTFQARFDFDQDGDASLSDEEIDAGRVTACEDLAGSLSLTADESLVPAPDPGGAVLPPRGRWPRDDARGVHLRGAARDNADRWPGRDRVQGRFISRSASAGGRSSRAGRASPCVTSKATSATASSDRLRRYPEDRISARWPMPRSVVAATAGGPMLPSLDVPDAAPSGDHPSVARIVRALRPRARARSRRPPRRRSCRAASGTDLPDIFRSPT